MMHAPQSRRLRLAILQRVCPPYRVALFTALTASNEVEARLFIGDDLPGSKVKSAANLDGVAVTRLRTRFLRLAGRTLPLHVDLIRQLRHFQPDVILCEGESNFLGYLLAMYYRFRYAKNIGLMHWCFISLPGCPHHRTDLAGRIKTFFRKRFDAFVVYSSYSKEKLVTLGEPAEKIFVATNVGDVDKHLALSDALSMTAEEARARLALPERFTVLYAGTLDANKRPDLLLEVARKVDPNLYNFVFLGGGALLDELRNRATALGLSKVFLPGRVTDSLNTYFRAANVLVVPGRGGIVISEAMAWRLPVIVHEADGTEHDLVQPGYTGYRLADPGVDALVAALDRLQKQPDMAASFGARGQQLVRERFTVRNMVHEIIEATRFAARVSSRRSA